MRIFTFLAAWLCGAAAFAGGPLPGTPEAPFRLYSVADGLNQKSVSALAQDQQGFLWVGTFGGVNRFDGRSFESFTTRQGLRQNQVQAIMVDSQNRVWAGDMAGGLSVIKNGQVVRTFEPVDGTRGVVRSIVQSRDTLYIGTQPGGLRSLDLKDMDSGYTVYDGAPNEMIGIVPITDTMFALLSSEGLHTFKPGVQSQFSLIDEGISALQADDTGAIAVGDRNGRIGWFTSDGIEWFEQQYEGSIAAVLPHKGELPWICLEGQGLIDVTDPEQEIVLPQGGTAPLLYDSEGVLWVPARAGLARYLGPRFKHYSLELDRVEPEVFALTPGDRNDFWFGTNLGLLHLDQNGELNSVTAHLGIEPREVRDVKFSMDHSTLWMGQVQGAVHQIDVETLSIVRTLGDSSSLNVSLMVDQTDRVWFGSYLGILTRYDPSTDTQRTFEMGNGAAIYSIALSSDGYLWFSANYKGLYRLNTLDENAEPEMIVEASSLDEEFLTQVVVQGAGSDTVAWFTTAKGGIYRWARGETTRVVSQELLSDFIVYSIWPLPDNTVITSTSRGIFRYDMTSTQLEQYTPFDGFLATEAKVHANYFDGEHTLFIGTTNGVSAMDVSIPMSGVGTPKPLFVERTVDDLVLHGELSPDELAFNRIMIEFTAVSTRKPFGIEYSYRLEGQYDNWSAPSQSTSISFSNLSPGPYRFDVRARLPGGQWSEPAQWSFTVPTPFWRTSWFIALMVTLALLITWSVVRLRLRSIAHANRRLRIEVAERTRSIEAGRKKLEMANQQLSSEIQERKKSDELRAEVEARFHQAYHNSPIGMALVDIDGLVYDANPRMKQLFWPDSAADDREPLMRIVADHDRERFARFLDAYAAESSASSSMEVDCYAQNGQIRRIDFHPSAIRDSDGELKYIVLMAPDVTKSRAMTDQLEYQARFDELTGLCNRRAFAYELEKAGRSSARRSKSFLMFLDLDQFKVVNDTCGHAAGDELLRNVARLLSGCVREHDTVARLGGDEFALILVGCEEKVALERAEDVRQRIQDLEFLWEQDVFRIGVSIGVVPIADANQDLNELQQIADAACYAAKEAGRNRVHLVSGKRDAAHEHRGEMRWVQRLNHAIDTNSFVLFGQRIENLDGTRATKHRIEILLRMRDRKTGRLIPPGAFMPAAERYGLQGRLDQWVISNVVDALRAQETERLESLQIWVNLSGASVGDTHIAQELIRQVKEANLPSGCLNFEITETAVIRKIDQAAELIEALQEMGCRFALDDFGSGLSSFGYLKKLNVDCLKIDGQFVRDIVTDPTDCIFVKSIIDIAHTLGMQVVAEFVENDAIRKQITELGSDYAQGFGIHRPEPLDSLVAMRRDTVPSAQLS